MKKSIIPDTFKPYSRKLFAWKLFVVIDYLAILYLIPIIIGFFD